MTFTPLENRTGHIWLDGKIIPWDEARFHFATHSLHYGGSIFEGMRAYNGKIYKCGEHVKRLFRSAELCLMQIPYSPEEIELASVEALVIQNLSDAYVRPLVFYDGKTLDIDPQYNDIHVAIAAWNPFPPPLSEPREPTIRLATTSWNRGLPQNRLWEAKAAVNYVYGTFAKKAAIESGADDALMLDSFGNVAEATTANIFGVMRGALFAPIPDCFLDGITRQSIISIAREFNIPVHVKHVPFESFMNMDGAFITGTACEVQHVVKIDNKSFPKHPITSQLMHAYSKVVRAKHG